MINLTEKNKQNETSEELGKSIKMLIEDTLDFERWDFKLSYSDFSKMSNQEIIYDSPSCRISFTFYRERLPIYDELRIYYGRLHATNDGTFMEWQGKKCHCWHNFIKPLMFLDGLSPQIATKHDKMGKHAPKVVDEFSSSDIGIKLIKEYPPKYALALEKVIWKNYGQRLFDLFDLRKPELWDQYKRFLQEYYQITGEKSLYGPPYENVC